MIAFESLPRADKCARPPAEVIHAQCLCRWWMSKEVREQFMSFARSAAARANANFRDLNACFTQRFEELQRANSLASAAFCGKLKLFCWNSFGMLALEARSAWQRASLQINGVKVSRTSSTSD